MKTDKELAMKVIDYLEEIYLRQTLMETMLDASKVPGWRQRMEEVLPYAPVRDIVRQQFSPVRKRILDAPDLTTAVREMLKDIPKNGPVG